MEAVQQLCFDLLHHVYESRHPLTASEIASAINQPLHMVNLLITRLFQSGYLHTHNENGVTYVQRPNQELATRPHLPLPYHILDWNDF